MSNEREQCDAVALANEYCHATTRCGRDKGHAGPHVAMIGDSSRRIWDDVTFPINYQEEKI